MNVNQCLKERKKKECLFGLIFQWRSLVHFKGHVSFDEVKYVCDTVRTTWSG